MSTLNETYQYIGRSNAVRAYAAEYYFYILLYAKTSGNLSTGKHKVTVLMRLATPSTINFYNYFTTGSATVAGVSAFSWETQTIPDKAWNTSSITEGGVTYNRWIDLKEGSVDVDVGYGVTKDVTIAASWKRLDIGTTPPSWLASVTPAKVSVTATLPMIASASKITSVADVTLGNKCAVKWTPMSAAFYYKMGFQLGSWKYSTEVVHPNRTTEYTYTGLPIPLEVANQIPDDTSGTMSVYLHTFSDSAGTVQIGDTSSATFKVTVPDNASTKPDVEMVLTPVHSLPNKFSGLYIQGKSKVKGTLSADGQYESDITSISMEVNGKSYKSDVGYTSDYLNTYGTINVTGYATDTRGFTGENRQEIEVVAYQDPKLENASAVRCDASGKESESGTYLKIKAKRSSTSVDGKNICKIQYRYSQDGVAYGSWVTLLESALSIDEVTTGALLGSLSIQASYVVHIRATDEIGRPAESFITVPTEKVYWHRDGARNALGLGKYNEQDNALDSAWDIHMNGNKVTGLPTPENATDAVPLGFFQDYVVAQGTSGIWAYRKWNSGLAELWCSVSATHQNGYVLASEEVNYPFTMTSALCGIGSLNSYGGNAATALPWNSKLAYGPSACKLWVHSSGGGFTADSIVYGSAYIIGRWK